MRSSILFFSIAAALSLPPGVAKAETGGTATSTQTHDETKAAPASNPGRGSAEQGLTKDTPQHIDPAPVQPGVHPSLDGRDIPLPPSPLPPRLDHAHQFGLEVGLGLGYRLIKPYGDIWCGQRSNDPDNPNEPFCSSMSPLFLDLGLTFGATKTVELVAHTRIGLMKDAISERHPISLLGGVRLWVDATGPFKWALGIEAMLDFTKQDGDKQKRPTYGVPEHDSLDVGGRFYGQIQYDFLPYLGVYTQIGGMVGALRWLRVELEGILGIQGRLPRF